MQLQRPAAKQGDNVQAPPPPRPFNGFIINDGVTTVFINGKRAATVDSVADGGSEQAVITPLEPAKVLINSKSAARIGDQATRGGAPGVVLQVGECTVLIG